jgi:hypothetical protein
MADGAWASLRRRIRSGFGGGGANRICKETTLAMSRGGDTQKKTTNGGMVWVEGGVGIGQNGLK